MIHKWHIYTHLLDLRVEVVVRHQLHAQAPRGGAGGGEAADPLGPEHAASE